jgi:hypothetical protein
VLHQRHGGRVAGGGGMAHLLPAGIFQPSSVLPAAVDPDLYDESFGDAVDNNAGGSIPRHIIPFEANTLGRLRELNQLSPGAAAALRLAWHHRTTLVCAQSGDAC